MLGNWKGSYKYDNEKIQKIVGHNETKFEIIIDKFDGQSFSGIVTDDEGTGGMKDAGQIVGRVENNKIYFEKLMPKNDRISSVTGNRRYSEKKHPKIYYAGKLSDDKSSFEGNWKFKKRLLFLFGIIPIIFNPGKGTWKMTRENNKSVSYNFMQKQNPKIK